LSGSLDESEKAHHGRQSYGKADRVDLLSVFFENLHLSQKKKSDGAFPVDDLQRFIRDIEKKYLLHIRLASLKKSKSFRLKERVDRSLRPGSSSSASPCPRVTTAFPFGSNLA
jgi:hypothetical protein